jgi:hypothetical protein
MPFTQQKKSRSSNKKYSRKKEDVAGGARGNERKRWREKRWRQMHLGDVQQLEVILSTERDVARMLKVGRHLQICPLTIKWIVKWICPVRSNKDVL